MLDEYLRTRIKHAPKKLKGVLRISKDIFRASIDALRKNSKILPMRHTLITQRKKLSIDNIEKLLYFYFISLYPKKKRHYNLYVTISKIAEFAMSFSAFRRDSWGESKVHTGGGLDNLSSCLCAMQYKKKMLKTRL